MKKRLFIPFICLFTCLGCFPLTAIADTPIEDGVYYISNTALEGYLGLGKYHDVDGVNKNGFSIHRHLSLRPCYGCID